MPPKASKSNKRRPTDDGTCTETVSPPKKKQATSSKGGGPVQGKKKSHQLQQQAVIDLDAPKQILMTRTVLLKSECCPPFNDGNVYIQLGDHDPKHTYIFHADVLRRFSCRLADELEQTVEEADNKTVNRIKKAAGIYTIFTLEYFPKRNIFSITRAVSLALITKTHYPTARCPKA